MQFALICAAGAVALAVVAVAVLPHGERHRQPPAPHNRETGVGPCLAGALAQHV